MASEPLTPKVEQVLRRRVRAYQTQFPTGIYAQDCGALLDEIDRLCAALQTLSDDCYCTEHCPTTVDTGRQIHVAECAVGIARAARVREKS